MDRPISGGQPTRLLPNASGLTWIANGKILFSEIMNGTGSHMGIVSSTEDRLQEQTIYFPSHERAMAHYSYSSPDRKSVLIVEMDRTTAWQRCRLLSLVTSQSRQVGPQGACISAGWSPDGEWMYFNSEVAGAWHLWRQRFSGGTPQQLTFGPSEQEGIAVSPDGRSLITSVGVRHSTVWFHNATGERPISSEAFAFLPRLSKDGKRVYYLFRQNPESLSSESAARERSSPFGLSGTLWSMDLATGDTARLLPDFSVTGYNLSPDGKEVAFTTRRGEESQIWLARLDRNSPPRLLIRGGGKASFVSEREIVFTAIENDRNFFYRMKTDGSGRERIANIPAIGDFGGSTNGEWIAALVPFAGQGSNWQTVALKIHGGDVRKICAFYCASRWSADGKFLYVDPDISSSASTGRTFVIPIQPGKSFPEIPAGGISTPADLRKLPGVRVIERSDLSPGPDPSTYVFARKEFQSNLFRLALPQ